VSEILGIPIRPERVVTALIPLTYLAMVLIECGGTGWRWPARRGWQLMGLGFFLLLGVVNGVVSGILLRLTGGFHLIDGSRLGVIPGALAGYVVVSFGNALMHRAYHRYGWLWRHVHQLHHAPQRLDVAGVMYQTPLEMAANAVLFIGVTTALLGLPPLAAMLCAYIAAFYGMFQHLNLRTPAWLGLFIQRPEAHCEHHRREVHAWNYSDLPLWDMLWGTFRNPAGFTGELGFTEGPSRRAWAMLRGHDVNAVELGDGRRGNVGVAGNPA
jgi:sterol desaturase/sphingolipid hydroxylase (fatty acid hydroxylase superfamily)